MKLLLLCLSFLFLMNCQNDPHNKTDSTFLKDNEQVVITEVFPQEDNISRQDTVQIVYLSFDLDSMDYQNMSLKSTPEEMKKIMGQADSIVDPNYECGFFSSEEQGEKFHQHFYGNMNFIVSKEKAELEQINFVGGQQMMTINEIEINHTTRYSELAKRLALPKAKEVKTIKIICEPRGGYDEHYTLTFENNLATAFEIWTPC